MAQRWPSASRPARDARMPRAPARGTPAVSAPEARRSTLASPHAHTSCCLLMARPDDRQKTLREQKVRTATEKLESMVDSIEAAPIAAKDAHARHPRPAPNRTETVPCCAVPCRAPFPQTHIRSRPRRIEPVISRSGAERDNQLT